MSSDQEKVEVPPLPRYPFSEMPEADFEGRYHHLGGDMSGAYQACLGLIRRMMHMRYQCDVNAAAEVVKVVSIELLGSGGQAQEWGEALVGDLNMAILQRWMFFLSPTERKAARPLFDSEYRRLVEAFKGLQEPSIPPRLDFHFQPND